MMILQKGKMEDGTVIQIEDWSGDYKFMTYGSTIAAYPISKMGYSGQFEPRKGETYRMTYNFKSGEEVEEAYSKLINGEITLRDIEKYLHDDRYKDIV